MLKTFKYPKLGPIIRVLYGKKSEILKKISNRLICGSSYTNLFF